MITDRSDQLPVSLVRDVAAGWSCYGLNVANPRRQRTTIVIVALLYLETNFVGVQIGTDVNITVSGVGNDRCKQFPDDMSGSLLVYKNQWFFGHFINKIVQGTLAVDQETAYQVIDHSL